LTSYIPDARVRDSAKREVSVTFEELKRILHVIGNRWRYSWSSWLYDL